MYSLQWSEEYAVGVEAIDLEHRELFDLYNELHGSMLRGESNSMTAAKRERLVQFTKEHFAAEERLMAESAYPRLAEHREAHLNLSEQVQKMMEEWKSQGSVLNLDAIKFLHDWITSHTLREDRAYYPWLQGLGKTEGQQA